MIEAPLGPDGRGRLLGVVRGLASETEAVRRALETIGPSTIGVSLSEEELASVREHFVGVDAEPLVPLMGTESTEVRGLARYGEVRLPHPGIVSALEWARLRSIPVAPLDVTDDEFAELFAENVGYLELLRRTLRERRLRDDPPEAPNADAFALAWEAEMRSSKGSAQMGAARDAAIAERVRRLVVSSGGPVAALVDRERFPGVQQELAARRTDSPERRRSDGTSK